MELVEKAELLRRLSLYALSKIHLDKYGSFRKILLILSWDINLNPGHGIQNKNLLHVLLFHECIFSEDSFRVNMSWNEWDVFQKRGMQYK